MNCSPVKNRIVIIPHSGSCLGRGWVQTAEMGQKQGNDRFSFCLPRKKSIRSTCQLFLQTKMMWSHVGRPKVWMLNSGWREFKSSSSISFWDGVRQVT